MKFALACFSLVAFLFSSSVPMAAQDLAAQIVGVWKYSSFTTKEVGTDRVNKPLGQAPVGLVIYTKGGRVAFAASAKERRAASGAQATETELRDLLRMFQAGTGTYKVEGQTLSVTYKSSLIQSFVGTTQTRTIEISDNKRLRVTAPPTKSPTGVQLVFVIEYERIE